MAKVFLSPATMVGASLAGALLLAAYLASIATRDEAPESAPAPRAAFAVQSVEPPIERIAAPAEPQPARAQPVAIASTCPTQAQTAARDAADGRFTLEAALASGSSIDPAAFVAVAREAAQQGRARDAETALLAACHVAERRSGAQSPTVADLKSRIASLHDPRSCKSPPARSSARPPRSWALPGSTSNRLRPRCAGPAPA
jgi:hypothetical protein